MPELRLRGGEVDGLELNYLVEGRGQGPAVVLVHGLGGFAESWRHNIGSLAARASVYAIDLPGFGRSGKPPAEYSLAFFARALHGFLDAVGVTQASLVGHSLGAAVAITYALTHPARVERLALLAGCVPGFGWRPGWRARVMATPVVGEALALCGCAPLYRAAIAKCFHSPADAEVGFLVGWDYATRTSAAARAAWLGTVRALAADFQQRRADYRRAIATLDLPVLFVHGRQDVAIPAAHCAEMADAFSRATVRWLDSCGHFPHIEHAPVVNGWLAEFLAGRRAPR
jgi:pimeloyl-ACP methyl ester carboxylesterase